MLQRLVPLSEAKARLSELARRVRQQHERIMSTRNGEAEAVLLSVDDLEGLELTLEILGDTEAVHADIRKPGRARPGEKVLTSPPCERILLAAALPARDSGRDASPRYELRFQRAARRAIAERLPEAVAAAVLEFCDSALALSPHRVGKPLFGPLDGCHGARRGTYRIVYRIDEDSRTVHILDIDHRADIYRPRA